MGLGNAVGIPPMLSGMRALDRALDPQGRPIAVQPARTSRSPSRRSRGCRCGISIGTGAAQPRGRRGLRGARAGGRGSDVAELRRRSRAAALIARGDLPERRADARRARRSAPAVARSAAKRTQRGLQLDEPFVMARGCRLVRGDRAARRRARRRGRDRRHRRTPTPHAYAMLMVLSVAVTSRRSRGSSPRARSVRRARS